MTKINFNQNPYNDDYDREKGFLRILFKPGVAVQARELTQIQRVIQNQISEFGDNIFTNGALVYGGDMIVEKNAFYVKLSSESNDTLDDTIIGRIFEGSNNGVKARVKNYKKADGGDPPTIYVSYVSGSTDGSLNRFEVNEVLEDTNSSTVLTVASTAPSGKSLRFSISAGVVYYEGNFVYFPAKEEIISKYSVPDDVIIGFEASEQIVTFRDDSTLLDPAGGSFNFAAPGADRFFVDMTITKRDFTPGAINDRSFIELIRIQNGQTISFKKKSEYNVINDVMARRTYDESGDYVVRPFFMELMEHLRNDTASRSGFFTAANGGDEGKYIMSISPGKAYVRGYEVDNFKSVIIESEKARDTCGVGLGAVSTPFGNFYETENIHSILPLNTIADIEIRDEYTSVPGSPAGEIVAVARVRNTGFLSGTPGTADHRGTIHVFDVRTLPGRNIAREGKQIFGAVSGVADFTADIVPSETVLSGSISVTSGSATATGVGSKFQTELVVGDFIKIDDERYRVDAIASDRSLTLGSNAVATASGAIYTRLTSSLQQPTRNTYIFPLPAEYIKSVDSTGTNTSYLSRRYYDFTLSSGTATLSAGISETFSGLSDDNYQIVVLSGPNAGDYVPVDGILTRAGAPVGSSLQINMSGLGYTNEDIALVATLQKSGGAADKKLKILQADAQITVTNEADATAMVVSLAKADVARIKSITVSADPFGSPFNATGAQDITSRYTLDNGQRRTFYDLGSVKLKEGLPAPDGPIRITFDYYTHTPGDFFTVNSYQGVDYKDIPSVRFGDTEFNLRDCVDYRPRVADNGTFTGGTASLTEFPDFEDDLITSYEYYLGRIDKVVVDRNGVLRVINGVSGLNPREPEIPEETMALYTIILDPYVFDIKKNSKVIKIDNRRYTMRDIGKLETRISNLEQYTTLSLLELEASQFQVKDVNGLDRFKNGFVVDAFVGHGVGNPFDSEYGVAIDQQKKELRPIADIRRFNLALDESNSTNFSRYGDIVFPTVSNEKVFIENNKTSRALNVNPYDVVFFDGTLNMTPSADVWFEDNRIPDVYVDVEGNYDTVLAEAQAKGTFGTIWGAWSTSYSGNYRNEQRSGTIYTVEEKIDVSVNRDKVVNSVVIPKMRDVNINMGMEGMKPNVPLFFFFNNVNVTTSIKGSYNEPHFIEKATGDVFALSELIANSINPFYAAGTPQSSILYIPAPSPDIFVITDANGRANASFKYRSNILNFNTGVHNVTATDSAFNDTDDMECRAVNTFTANGTKRDITDEYISTRNGVLKSDETTGSRSTYIPPSPPPSNSGAGSSTSDQPTSVVTPVKEPPVDDFILQLYNGVEGRSGDQVDQAGYQFWSNRAAQLGNDTAAKIALAEEFVQGSVGQNQHTKKDFVGIVDVISGGSNSVTDTNKKLTTGVFLGSASQYRPNERPSWLQ